MHPLLLWCILFSMNIEIQTKIFLDSGNPSETKKALEILKYLDGQTTNPSLIVKNPEVQKCLSGEKTCSEGDLLLIYRDVVSEIRTLLGEGKSVSIEVYADKNTTAEDMIAQGTTMNSWIPGAHIKLPITKAGLTAANHFVAQGINVNMTLCFSQEQAVAVHRATIGAQEGQVLISPFVGRLDDIGEQGLDLIKNIIFQYEALESHVQVLAASIRSVDHFAAIIDQACDLITVPLQVIEAWASSDYSLDYTLNPELQRIPYVELDTDKEYTEYDITHDLTEKGLGKFAADWKSIFTTNE